MLTRNHTSEGPPDWLNQSLSKVEKNTAKQAMMVACATENVDVKKIKVDTGLLHMVLPYLKQHSQ